MSKKKYDPIAALRRTQDASAAAESMGNPTVAGDVGEAIASMPVNQPAPAGANEYVLISVWRIDPAPWQSRLVFRDIDELVESIRGDGDTEGVGVVEPVLVRPSTDGRYQLLDGERRWRAAKLITRERADGDFLLPARVFNVSDRVGQLIGQAANDERDMPKPLERALCYRRLREALEQESPGQSIGVRKVAGIGWHKRSRVRDYLAIADRLTPAVLQAAGVLDTSGRVEEAVVTKLTVTDLLAVASAETEEARVAALRAKADRARGIKPAAPARPAEQPVPLSPEERLTRMREVEGLSIRVRVPLRTLAPAAARELVTNEVGPAMVALVEQAEGHAGGEGYHGEFGADRTVLVVPREVEQLSAAQLEALMQDVSSLAKRVRSAARFRRGRRGLASINARRQEG